MVSGAQLKEVEADIMGAGKLSAASHAVTHMLSSLEHVSFVPLSLQTESL